MLILLSNENFKEVLGHWSLRTLVNDVCSLCKSSDHPDIISIASTTVWELFLRRGRDAQGRAALFHTHAATGPEVGGLQHFGNQFCCYLDLCYSQSQFGRKQATSVGNLTTKAPSILMQPHRQNQEVHNTVRPKDSKSIHHGLNPVSLNPPPPFPQIKRLLSR